MILFNNRALISKLEEAEKLRNQEQFYFEYNLASNTANNEYGFIAVKENYKIVNSDILSDSAMQDTKKLRRARGFSPYLILYKGIDSPISKYVALIEENKKYKSVISDYSPLENKVYITRQNVSANSLSNLKIYTATLDEDFVLGKLEEFPFNGDNYSVGHPSVSKDGKMLYFVSDKPGGFGGTDLYRCMKLESGVWGAPINLGGVVNTKGDELYPHISAQGNTLYFSSTVHSIFGGLDINKSIRNRSNTFKTPENLGLPFNSDKDDFGIIFNDNYGTEGFYSTNCEEGKGGIDVFYFSFQNNKVCREPVKNFKMTVIDKKTKKPIPHVRLKMTVRADGRTYDDVSDEKGEVNLTVEGCNDFDVEATRDLYLNNLFYYDGFRKSVTIELDRKELNNIVELERILYEVGKSEVPARCIPQLDKLSTLLKKNTDIKIELSSHTDSRGADEFNLNLSQKRAESIVTFLINSGVSSSQLVARGYGESQLVNSCGNDSNCPEEMHEPNRRTEFKILEIAK